MKSKIGAKPGRGESSGFAAIGAAARPYTLTGLCQSGMGAGSVPVRDDQGVRTLALSFGLGLALGASIVDAFTALGIGLAPDPAAGGAAGEASPAEFVGIFVELSSRAGSSLSSIPASF